MRAIESAELLGRPTCSECSDMLRSKRGCFRPGFSVKGSMAWRFSSPYLAEADQVINECPTGLILREGPHIYDAIHASTYAENGAISPLEQTTWMQHAMRVVSSERARIRDIREKQYAAERDASYASRTLAAR